MPQFAVFCHSGMWESIADSDCIPILDQRVLAVSVLTT